MRTIKSAEPSHMAKKFTLKASLLDSLTGTLVIAPKELFELIPDADLALIRKEGKLVDELAEANLAYTDARAKLIEEANKVVAGHKERYAKAKDDGLDDESLKKIEAEINEEMKAELKALEDASPVKTLADAIIEVTVSSDERFDLLKTLLNAKGMISKWNVSKALIEVADAVEAAVEA